MNERRKFCVLLHDLCRGIPSPPAKMGRPRLPLRDMLFCAVFKTYSTLSGRRMISDLADCHERGYLSRVPHYNSIFNYLEEESLKEHSTSLITQSTLPLKTVETNFAVDASGFSTSGSVRWFNCRYGHEQDNQDWRKMHLCCGVTTNIVTAVEISGRYEHDYPYLAPLVKETARHFALGDVVADKGYSGRDNFNVIGECGGTPYIMFRKNAIPDPEGSEPWERAWHLFALNRQEFLAHYHQRSNVESTFSMIKAKFGDRITCKTDAGQINEALTKVLAHNICVLIQAIYELGIEPAFWQGSPVAQKVGVPEVPAQKVLATGWIA